MQFSMLFEVDRSVNTLFLLFGAFNFINGKFNDLLQNIPLGKTFEVVFDLSAISWHVVPSIIGQGLSLQIHGKDGGPDTLTADTYSVIYGRRVSNYIRVPQKFGHRIACYSFTLTASPRYPYSGSEACNNPSVASPGTKYSEACK